MHRETSLPPLVEIGHNQSMLAEIVNRITQYPAHPAFLLPGIDASGQADWNSAQEVRGDTFLSHVKACASYLLSQGVQVGERIGVMAPTSYAWTVVDCAIWWVGAVVVPLYETSSVEQVRAMCETVNVRRAFGTKKTIPILCEAGISEAQVWEMNLLAAPGDNPVPQQSLSDQDEAQLAQQLTALNATDPATIVFTSGTTGTPKPAVITHRNMLSQVSNVAAAYREIVNDRGSTLIFLPLAHILARGLQCVCLREGMRISYEPSPKAVLPALESVKPTFMVAPPRLLEKIMNAAGEGAKQKHLGWFWRPWLAQVIERGRAAEVADLQAANLKVPALSQQGMVRPRPWLFKLGDALFGRLLRQKLGGRMEFFLSGAAPLACEVSWFFRGLGVSVVEGYGLTETTAPATGNRPGRIKSGTVGPVIPGTTVRLGEDGQVLLAGPGVFGGYLDGTGLDSDGFFDTGDLGELDEDGYLTITGRAKNLIITSYGKNISPDAWQSQVELHPLVDAAMVVGEGKPFVTALIVLDQSVPQVRDYQGGEQFVAEDGTTFRVVSDPSLRAEVEAAVAEANENVSAPERVKRFHLLSFDHEGEVFTATRKLRRPVLEKVCAPVITRLYS
ncbi:hypothetical protein BK816_07565 [Boudabousia tangfeifanii]|uniref:AMP-dependent synthetase/ligase domain-containing protein n=1 Tax=Boudabousia tangfeifanii TaxID=1912795 RepID=A0A1D9MLQ3_9ACTO|nr:AMP-binding protein [Boudabousia tangfeifanii]AOZ73168.1 hypothetical protein BK816_07565 [Boudabousia tangfeifanii]